MRCATTPPCPLYPSVCAPPPSPLRGECMNLANQTCTWPCDPNERPCSTVEAAARLSAEGLSERWTVTEELEKSLAGDFVEQVPKLVAKVELPTFAAAAQLAARVAALAEAEGHFPDVRFGWQYLELRVFTHVANGLCLNDFILVAKLDELLRRVRDPRLSFDRRWCLPGRVNPTYTNWTCAIHDAALQQPCRASPNTANRDMLIMRPVCLCPPSHGPTHSTDRALRTRHALCD